MMKVLNCNGEKFQAKKIIKTETDIIGQDINNTEVFAFKGISDFSGFVLEEGQTFDIVLSTQQELLNAKILKDSLDIKIQLTNQQKLNADILLKLSKIGGATNV